MGKYLRTNYRTTGSYINNTPPKPKAPGAVFVSLADKAIYVYMSGASWLCISASTTTSINT